MISLHNRLEASTRRGNGNWLVKMEPNIRGINKSLARLTTAESVLEGTDCSPAAKLYARSLLREAVSPLEAINNLVYVAKQRPDNSETLQMHLLTIEGQLERLIEIVRRSLLYSESSAG